MPKNTVNSNLGNHHFYFASEAPHAPYVNNILNSLWRIVEWTSFVVSWKVLLSGSWLLFAYLKTVTLDIFFISIAHLEQLGVFQFLRLILNCNVKQLRITLEDIPIAKFSFSWVTISAQRHIHISAANQCLNALVSCTECERGILFAKLADSWQLLYFFAQRYQVCNYVPGTAQESTLQTSDDNNFVSVRSLFRKLNQIGEELSLVNANNIVWTPRVAQLLKGGDSCGIAGLSCMCCDLSLIFVAIVTWKLYAHYFFTRNLLEGNLAQ